MQGLHRLSSCSNLDRPSSSSLCQWSEESQQCTTFCKHQKSARPCRNQCLFRNQCGSLVAASDSPLVVDPRWASFVSWFSIHGTIETIIETNETKPRGNQRHRTLSTGRPVVPCRAVSSRRLGRALWWTCPSSGRPSKPLAGLPPVEHKASWKQKDQKNLSSKVVDSMNSTKCSPQSEQLGEFTWINLTWFGDDITIIYIYIYIIYIHII